MRAKKNERLFILFLVKSHPITRREACRQRSNEGETHTNTAMRFFFDTFSHFCKLVFDFSILFFLIPMTVDSQIKKENKIYDCKYCRATGGQNEYQTKRRGKENEKNKNKIKARATCVQYVYMNINKQTNIDHLSNGQMWFPFIELASPNTLTILLDLYADIQANTWHSSNMHTHSTGNKEYHTNNNNETRFKHTKREKNDQHQYYTPIQTYLKSITHLFILWPVHLFDGCWKCAMQHFNSLHVFFFSFISFLSLEKTDTNDKNGKRKKMCAQKKKKMRRKKNLNNNYMWRTLGMSWPFCRFVSPSSLPVCGTRVQYCLLNWQKNQ